MTDAALAAPGLHRSILAIAAPSMATNVATALFGMADMWVIGRLGEAAPQGAVEVGVKLLMTVLIVFNFLRSGTVALTAQAAGREDAAAQAATLVRGVAAALAIGAALLLARPLVIDLGLRLFGAGGSLPRWRGPMSASAIGARLPWLINAVLVGWLIGRKRMGAVLAVEVGSNIAHVALDLSFVLILHWGVAGVAAATLTSETLKLAALSAWPARGAGAARPGPAGGAGDVDGGRADGPVPAEPRPAGTHGAADDGDGAADPGRGAAGATILAADAPSSSSAVHPVGAAAGRLRERHAGAVRRGAGRGPPGAVRGGWRASLAWAIGAGAYKKPHASAWGQRGLKQLHTRPAPRFAPLSPSPRLTPWGFSRWEPDASARVIRKAPCVSLGLTRLQESVTPAAQRAKIKNAGGKFRLYAE